MEKSCSLVHFDGGTPAIANDIKKALGGNDDTTKIDALKNAISLLQNGETLPQLFIIIVRYVLPLEDHTITFSILVKLLMSVEPGEYMELLKIEVMEAKERVLKMVRKIVDDRKSAMEKNESKGSVLSNDVIDVLLWDIEDPTPVDHEDGLNLPLSNLDADAAFILLFISSSVLFKLDEYDESEKMDADLINARLSVYNPTGSEKMAA
ncbi:coatomer subunit beta-1 [Tanacetum coccineum]